MSDMILDKGVNTIPVRQGVDLQPPAGTPIDTTFTAPAQSRQRHSWGLVIGYAVVVLMLLGLVTLVAHDPTDNLYWPWQDAPSSLVNQPQPITGGMAELTPEQMAEILREAPSMGSHPTNVPMPDVDQQQTPTMPSHNGDSLEEPYRSEALPQDPFADHEDIVQSHMQHLDPFGW